MTLYIGENIIKYISKIKIGYLIIVICFTFYKIFYDLVIYII